MQERDRHRDIIVVGGSAGAVEAMTTIVRALPAELPAAVFLVIHISADARSTLPAILNRAGILTAGHFPDGEPILPGRIYIAPPDHHLLVRPGHVHLSRGPRENGHRPAVDALFRSAAHHYGDRVIGVVLSGNLDDGTAGLLAITARNGVSIALDPSDALYSAMPRNAIRGDHVDHVLSTHAISAKLQELVAQPLVEAPPKPSTVGQEEYVRETAGTAEVLPPGDPSGISCPECKGVLWQCGEEKHLHFQCRTGHTYSPQSLFARQTTAVEDALWAALAALEERASLAKRIAERAQEAGRFITANRYTDQRQVAIGHAQTIRDLLFRGQFDANPAEPGYEDELALEAQAGAAIKAPARSLPEG
jgi:two-component system chemotaxis response regulator CheB